MRIKWRKPQFGSLCKATAGRQPCYDLQMHLFQIQRMKIRSQSVIDHQHQMNSILFRRHRRLYRRRHRRQCHHLHGMVVTNDVRV